MVWVDFLAKNVVFENEVFFENCPKKFSEKIAFENYKM